MLPSLGVIPITYARSRLWLGISGVGSLVVLSTLLLWTGLPSKWLPGSQQWSSDDFSGLMAIVGGLVVVMMPLDLLGGFLLPNRSRPGTTTAAAFVQSWARGAMFQACVFFLVSVLILAMGRLFGLLGAVLAVIVVGLLQVVFQLRIAQLAASLPNASGRGQVNDAKDTSAGFADAKLAEAVERVAEWGWGKRPVLSLENRDTGFTGGLVGLPGRESVVLPSLVVEKLTADQLAVTIARRLEAIRSGARTRGLVVAFAWVTLGFVLASMLPGAGVQSVAELTMTYLGFTIWTFLGLLVLPTLSRQATYAIDRNVMGKGVEQKTLTETLRTLDRLQDDEAQRSALIETIFHPVPSVNNRSRESGSTFPIAWHAARMTLFVSWASVGMLVRAVHCNVGRPELWVLLPAD